MRKHKVSKMSLRLTCALKDDSRQLEGRIDALAVQITPGISIDKHLDILREVSILQHRLNVTELRSCRAKMPIQEYEILH